MITLKFKRIKAHWNMEHKSKIKLIAQWIIELSSLVNDNVFKQIYLDISGKTYEE